MLIIISTPIGNLGDITQRAAHLLAQADIIACEDTRQTRKLLSLLSISSSAELWAYHDHNGAKVRPKLINVMKAGQQVALASDAGTPLISDPGYKLVTACLENDIPVTAAPGPTAPIVALTLSGLPSDRFSFQGFVPQKKKAARDALEESRLLTMTQIWFETPKRLAATLKMMAGIYGNRYCVIARELTKLHETLYRGMLADLAKQFEGAPILKGELVLVVDGADKHTTQVSIEKTSELLSARMHKMSLRDAVKEVEDLSGLPRKQIYQLALSVSKNKH
ncbi:MAG: 16S rRNA (cytidine(1402)-2'-O)-methyltransferase [Candidatus Puniceispirillaceae bacterium]